MSKMRKRLKRILAALLAVCVVMTSFNGVAWADEGPDETVTYESKDVLFKLDAEQIRESAASAIQDGMMSGETFDADSLGVSSKGNAKKTYAEFFADNGSQVFEMVVPYAYDENNEENNRWMDEVPDGASMRMFVRVAKTATASDAEMAEGDEEQSEGEIEEFLFLFINNSEYNLNFKVDINGRQTATVKVPCKAAMSPKKATSSNANAPAAVGNGSIATTLETTKPAETTPASSEIVSESASIEETVTGEGVETSTTDETGSSEEIKTSTSEEVSTGEEISTEETIEPNSSEEKTTEKSEETTTEAVKESETEETIAPTTEKETEATQNETTEAAEEETTEAETTEAATEETEAPVVEEESEVESVESEELVIVSKSFNNVPMVGAGLEDDDEPQNPQEEYNMMMGRDRYDDGDEDDDDFYFDDGDTITTEAAPAEIAGKVIAPALVAGTQTNLLSLLTFDLSEGTNEGVIAGFAADKDDVLLKEEEKTSLFRATLYDYSGTNKNNAQINAYLQKGTTTENGFKFQTGAFGGEALKKEIQNAWALEKGNNKYNMNIVQGITNPEYVNGHLQNRFTSVDLFPDKQPAGQEDALRVYQEVNVDKIFEKSSDGYYHFDSFENSVKYKNGALVPLETSDNLDDYKNPGNIQDGSNQPGFWPFGKNNWFFGMKLSFDFSVMEDGTYNGEEMIFKFQGDDDVWVYLTNTKDKTKTGRIVLDVGGNHNRMGGSINFATGEIKYYRVNNTIWNNPVVTYQRNADNTSWINWTNETSDDYANAYLYTLDDLMTRYHLTEEQANARYPLGFMGFNREELAEYQLDFYYLERGGNASNCYLDFNIPVFRQDEISISKRVYSETTEDKEEDYQFKLFTKGKNETEFTEYNKIITLKGSGKGSTKTIDQKFLEGTQYYFVEIKDGDAATTTWLSNGTTSKGENEKTSPIYTVGQQNNVVCSNYFNMNMDGAVEKTAIQNAEIQDEYDIQLTVNGNTLTTDSEEEETEDAYLTDLVVTDPLSKYVDFILDADGYPQLAVAANDGPAAILIGEKKGNLIEYAADGSNIKVAEVDVENKVITWYVTNKDEKLGKGDTRKLTYKVKTTEEAIYYADETLYPNVGERSTGTLSKKTGYYSNGNEAQSGAILRYRTTIDPAEQKKEFPHPVVRPIENGVLKITKIVDSEITPGENTKFTFNVELIGIKGTVIVKQLPNQELSTLSVSNGIVKDTIQLGHNESVQYYGLNKEVQYTITETVFDSKEHQSALEKVEVRKNNVLVNTVEKPSSNMIVGSMNRMVDDGNEYGYVELEMDPDATFWAKATEKTDWVRDPDVLGNNGGMSTSKLLDANGWWRNNTDGLLSQWDKFVKKEIGEVETPHELKKETKTYYTAKDIGEQHFNTVEEIKNAIKEKYASLGGTEKWIEEENTIQVKYTIESDWYYSIWPFIGTWAYKIGGNLYDNYSKAITVVGEASLVDIGIYKKSRGEWKKIDNPTGAVKENTQLRYSSPAITYTKNTDTQWTFKDQTYTSFNDLKAAIISAYGEKSNPQYNETSGTVTYSTFENVETSVPMTVAEISAEGYTPVKYITKASVLTSVNAIFTNSYSEKSKPALKLTKQVLGDSAPATADAAEKYEFVMYKKAADGGKDSIFTGYTVNGAAPDETKQSFTIGAAYLEHNASVDIIFNDSDVTGTFYLKEVNAGTAKETAWDGDEFTITSSTDKLEATCINTYWMQELTIQKTVSGTNPDESAFYHFEVQLKANETEAMSGNVDVSVLAGKAKADLAEDKEYAENETLSLTINNGKIDFYLSDGGAVKILNLPKDTVYQAREILSDNNAYYTVNLTGIKKNNVAVEDFNIPVTGTLTKENLSDAVEFINSYTMKTMSLSLTKKLVDEAGEAKADIEDVTFVFEIINQDPESPGYNDSFYRRLTIPAGSTEMTIVIQNLPVSNTYKVVEMDHMRYELVGANGKVANATENSIVFENKKVSNGRFSSTSAVTNKVNGQFGFVQHKEMPNEELPQRTDIVLMALPPKVKTSNFDSDGYDDGDTQLI